MGYFSFECKGCNQDLVEGEEVRLNGCKGEYDGYGGCGTGDGCVDHSPAAWHKLCYSKATDAEKLDETPSRNARNQGFGWPRQDCMPEGSSYVEPPRLHFKDVSSVDVRVYLDALYADEQKDSNTEEEKRSPYWFNAARHVRLEDEEEPVLFTPEDLTTSDYAEAYASFGDRWEHNYLDPDYLPGGDKARGSEYWGENGDPGDLFWAMDERFQGKHTTVSTIAHAIIAGAKKRLRADPCRYGHRPGHGDYYSRPRCKRCGEIAADGR